MGGFKLLPSTSLRRRLRKQQQHSRTKQALPSSQMQDLSPPSDTPPDAAPEVKSAGGAFCSGLSRSDGSILRSVLGQSTRRPSLTKSEWKYSGQEDHHAHAPKCARRRRSSFGSTCSNDMETLKTLDSAMSAMEAHDQLEDHHSPRPQEEEEEEEQQQQEDTTHTNNNHNHNNPNASSQGRGGDRSALSSSEPHSRMMHNNTNSGGGGGGILMRTMGSRRINNVLLNEDEEYNFQLARSKRLPGTWYFSSNHVLVNKARTKRDIAALIRDSKIDDLARDIAHTLMNNTLEQLKLVSGNEEDENYSSCSSVSRSSRLLRRYPQKKNKNKNKKNHHHHQQNRNTSQEVILRSGFEILDTCNPQELIIKLVNGPFRRIGYNFAMGKSIRAIHKHMMKEDISCQNNMLDRRFEYFGMGTATHRSGNNGETELYMVQLYVS